MEEQFNKRNGAKERVYNIGQKAYAKLYKFNNDDSLELSSGSSEMLTMK